MTREKERMFKCGLLCLVFMAACVSRAGKMKPQRRTNLIKIFLLIVQLGFEEREEIGE